MKGHEAVKVRVIDEIDASVMLISSSFFRPRSFCRPCIQSCSTCLFSWCRRRFVCSIISSLTISHGSCNPFQRCPQTLPSFFGGASGHSLGSFAVFSSTDQGEVISTPTNDGHFFYSSMFICNHFLYPSVTIHPR